MGHYRKQQYHCSLKITYQKDSELVIKAAKTAGKYFLSLSEGTYEDAYELISDVDKSYISRQDFLEWQTAVSCLYEIRSCSLEHCKTTIGRIVGFEMFSWIFEFSINLIERDKISEKQYTVELTKSIVMEETELKVYLGYTDIRVFTDRLREINNHRYSRENEDYDRQMLLNEINREIIRAKRYSRPFSILLLESVNCWSIVDEKGIEYYKGLLSGALEHVRGALRDTDICGRWNADRILVLMPETVKSSARIVTKRIMSKLETASGVHSTDKKLIFCAGVLQFNGDCLKNMFGVEEANELLAKKMGDWNIVL